MLRYGIRLSVSVVTFLLGLALAAAPSLLPSDAPHGGAFEQEVLDANREYLQAHLNRDVATLDSLLADEFVVRGRHRSYVSKAERLEAVGDPDFKFLSIDSSDTRVVAGEDRGEVSGRAVMRSSYMGREYTSPPYRYTRRFERRGGRWQLVDVEVYRGHQP